MEIWSKLLNVTCKVQYLGPLSPSSASFFCITWPFIIQVSFKHNFLREVYPKSVGFNNLQFTSDWVVLSLGHRVESFEAMYHFPVVMYGCEIWTVKKAEHRKIDAFELWRWRRLLWVPWTARRSNQSILKEISLKYSLEGLMLKLRLQYFGHLIWRIDSSEKTLMLGKIEGRKRTGWQRMMVGWHHWLHGHEFE